MTIRQYALLFVAVAGTVAVGFWWSDDWWYSVDLPDGPMPKFKAPLIEQLACSGFVGVLAASFVIGVVSYVREFRYRVTVQRHGP